MANIKLFIVENKEALLIGFIAGLAISIVLVTLF
jgi:hypothetical protein